MRAAFVDVGGPCLADGGGVPLRIVTLGGRDSQLLAFQFSRVGADIEQRAQAVCFHSRGGNRPGAHVADGVSNGLPVQLALEHIGLRARRSDANPQAGRVGIAQECLRFACWARQGFNQSSRQFVSVGELNCSVLFSPRHVASRFM